MIAVAYKDGQPTGLVLETTPEKPTITQADADTYRANIDYLLLEDNTQIAPSALPEASPLTDDVEKAAAALAARRRTREDVIFSDTSGLVATCYAWLQRTCAVPGGGTNTKTAGQALQAGQALCSPTSGHGSAIRAWIDFASPDFYQAMSSADNDRPWLEWVPAGEPKSIREAILDRVYLATYGTPRPA